MTLTNWKHPTNWKQAENNSVKLIISTKLLKAIMRSVIHQYKCLWEDKKS